MQQLPSIRNNLIAKAFRHFPKNRKAISKHSKQIISTLTMDGDHSGKTLDAGANAATKTQDLTEGIHEGATQAVSSS